MKILNGLGLSITLLALAGCGSTLSSSSKPIDPGTLRANGGTTTDNPMTTMKVSFAAYQAPVSLTFCTKSSSLLAASTTSGGFAVGQGNGNGNGNVGSGLGNGNGNGTGIPSFDLSSGGGYYQTIQSLYGLFNLFVIQVGTGCAGGKSIEVENTHGRFGLTSEGTLRFLGSISVSATNNSIQLNLANYATALSEARSDADVAQILSSTTGTF